ncbi:MAG: DUF1194 domain-containing protein [Pseudomonadota bacterium]
MRHWIAAALLLLTAWTMRPALAQSVDVELVLLADASGSIDQAELLFQRQGYAQALLSPEVLAAIGDGLDGRIALTYVEWAAAESQDVVVPWTVIDGIDSARSFGEALMRAPRRAFGRNAIGSAIAKAQALIETDGPEGFRKVIDISADSARSWSGVPLPEARANATAAGIVVNGLAILCPDVDCSGRPAAGDLEAAFADRIIAGPGAFVVTAADRASFADAVRKKLVLEIADRRGVDGVRYAASASSMHHAD